MALDGLLIAIEHEAAAVLCDHVDDDADVRRRNSLAI